MKKCTCCGEIKELSEFGQRNRKKKDNTIYKKYLSYCKKCNSEKSKNDYNKKKQDGLNFVYKFLNEDNEVIYVGKTSNLPVRLAHHLSKSNSHLPEEARSEISKVQYMVIGLTSLMDIKEIYYINLYKPKYNQKYLYSDEYSFIITDFLNDVWIDYNLDFLKNINKENLYLKIKSIFKRKRGNNYLVYIEYLDTNNKICQKRYNTFKNQYEADECVNTLKDFYKNNNLMR